MLYKSKSHHSKAKEGRKKTQKQLPVFYLYGDEAREAI
jgi:hypothetical protein